MKMVEKADIRNRVPTEGYKVLGDYEVQRQFLNMVTVQIRC